MRLLLGAPVCVAILGLGIAFLFLPRKVRGYQLRWPGFDENENWAPEWYRRALLDSLLTPHYFWLMRLLGLAAIFMSILVLGALFGFW